MSSVWNTHCVWKWCHGAIWNPFGAKPQAFQRSIPQGSDVHSRLPGPWDHGTMGPWTPIRLFVKHNKTHPPRSSQNNILGRKLRFMRNLQLLEQQREGPRAKVFCLGSPEAQTQWDRVTWTLLTGEASLKSMAAPFSTKAFTITWQRCSQHFSERFTIMATI